MEGDSHGEGMCHRCKNPLLLTEESRDQDVTEKCMGWLEKCSINSDGASFSSDISELSGTTIDSETTNNSALDSGFQILNQNTTVADLIFTNNNHNEYNLETVIKRKPLVDIEKIEIYKSKKVHVGDVTYINGPVYVNTYQTATIPESKAITNNGAESAKFVLITRRTWLAQPPLEIEYLKRPANFVVIGHSASDEAYTQADNIFLVRMIQSFHMDSRKWSDIAYNFLIGADGSVFEGRGWNVRGAQSGKYNKFSVGICFIGCYIRIMPSKIALSRAQQIIEHGLKIGAISEDYSLLGHCQCTSVESPGELLYNEIKKWPHWDSSISPNSPSELLTDFGAHLNSDNAMRSIP